MASNRRNTGLESTTALYKHVISEVCEKVQGEFINAGIDESVLHDLKWLWKRNVAKSQCCAHEQEAADEFAEFGFKIEELKPQQQLQQSESEDQDEQQKSMSQQQQAQDDDDDLSPITDDEQPAEQQSQSTADQGMLQFLPLTSTNQQQSTGGSNKTKENASSSSKRKRAAADDVDDDDDDNNKKSNDQPQSKKTQNTSKLDAQKQNLDEVDLGSDLDDSSDQEEDYADDNSSGQQSGNVAQSGNSSVVGGVKKSKSQPAGLILCQYDKVTRSRNKWKTQLRDGVANVNGRDYVFSRAQLEFQF
ncbi:hypothetical protein MIR68_005894 [Amoeboaphelidium protococcarum]|nr:hypothetical protein MIR68_005894 [Amoeboaphelidium protococcarum]